MLRRHFPTIARALFVVALAAARPASADEGDDQAADAGTLEARAAFKRGTELAKVARWDDARVEFERSYALKPHPITTYNIAFSDRAMGRPARALVLFQRALEEHEARKGGELPQNLIVLVHTCIDEASERVARVRLRLPSGARLSIDGHPLESFRMRGETLFVVSADDSSAAEPPSTNSPTVLLDPGTHVFMATLPGHADAVVTRRLEPGAETDLELRLNATAPARSLAAKRPPAEGQKAPSEPGSGFDRRWAYAILGVGGAALVAGAISGSVALRKRSELVDVCGPDYDDCPRSSQGDIDWMETSADIASGAFLVSAAAAATGITLLLVTPAPSEKPQQSSLALRLSANGATLVGELR